MQEAQSTLSVPASSGARRRRTVAGLLQSLSGLFANIFGAILLVLAALVAVETLGRKLLGFSLQGVDELGGYALAVGSALAFTTALVERAHIRIELFHVMLPGWLQMILNWVAITLIAAFGMLLAWVCATILLDSWAYRSTAPTPWATPLIWPQSVWYAGLVVFALVAGAMAVHATVLLLTGRWKTLDKLYGPKEAVEDVKEELEDLARR